MAAKSRLSKQIRKRREAVSKNEAGAERYMINMRIFLKINNYIECPSELPAGGGSECREPVVFGLTV